MVSKDALIKRLQELYLYSLYGFSSELKPLSMILDPGETVNFFARGLHDGTRQMLVITDARIIFINAPRLSTAGVKVVDRDAVTGHSVSKIMFNSCVRFSTGTDVYEMTRVPSKVLDLFEWSLEQPVKYIPGINRKKKSKKEQDK
ncbi:MAG: hypothetical protein PHO44_07460 [Sphaerochaetaceae bacterium]|nr:hypothetical protein [Sphaerochaetaceae bacterium]